jgi:hypothetical protein
LIVGPVIATADTGNDTFLSRQRAEALQVHLILNRISPAMIDTRGWGQPPMARPSMPRLRRRHRRRKARRCASNWCVDRARQCSNHGFAPDMQAR